MKDKINIKGIVRVQILSRDGRVIEERTLRNTVLVGGANDLLNVIRGTYTVNPWNKVNIYDRYETYIKTLTGSWSDILGGAGYNYIVLIAEDTSTDDYYFGFFGLDYTTRTILGDNRLAYDYGTTGHKASDQILKVTWEIRISYSTI